MTDLRILLIKTLLNNRLKINYMNTELKNEILEKIDNIFIEDFEVINKSFISINEYLNSNNLQPYENYNVFCCTIKSKFKKYIDASSEENYNLNLTKQLDLIFNSLITDKFLNENI